jgi:hypothetical protein
MATILLAPASLRAQFSVDEFVITPGISVEGYRGNLPSVGIPVQDSTESATALIAEVAVQSDASFRRENGDRLFLTFDGGLRQLSAHGFKLRNYQPREWVGTLDAGYSWTVGERLSFVAHSRLRGRQVENRPPMPLYLPPGYRTGEAGVGVSYRGPGGLLYDASITIAQSDYLAPQFAPQIRLLDQDRIVAQGGARVTVGGVASARFYGALEASRYPKQTTFAPEDPFRRDRTYYAGASFSYSGERLVQLSVEGRANRSNSNRPEYNAIAVRGFFSTAVPRDLRFTASGSVTAKTYLHDSEFARLLPGEEANSASLIYLSLSKQLEENLEGTFRIGWTRAETEIGDAYFARFGASLIFHYRP